MSRGSSESGTHQSARPTQAATILRDLPQGGMNVGSRPREREERKKASRTVGEADADLRWKISVLARDVQRGG